MQLTDKQIYDDHPDIAALNTEAVGISRQLPLLQNQIVEANEAAHAVQAEARGRINIATEAAQQATKQLKLVQAEEQRKVRTAAAKLGELQSQQQQLVHRKNEVVKRHNELLQAVQAEHAAREEAEEPVESAE